MSGCVLIMGTLGRCLRSEGTSKKNGDPTILAVTFKNVLRVSMQ